MGGDRSRVAYVDEWMSDYGWSASDGLESALRGGQYICVKGMAHTLAAAIEAAHAEYVAECEAEELEAHDVHMWWVHGCPAGPLGGAS